MTVYGSLGSTGALDGSRLRTRRQQRDVVVPLVHERQQPFLRHPLRDLAGLDRTAPAPRHRTELADGEVGHWVERRVAELHRRLYRLEQLVVPAVPAVHQVRIGDAVAVRRAQELEVELGVEL